MDGVTTWTPDDVAAAAERFAGALADADPAAAVPACPGWTVADLVAHLGNVHTWAAAIVMSGGRVEAPDGRPGETALDGWYAARAVHLVGVLSDADPDAPCWSFARVHQTVGFWNRRQLHETLMHLVDLDQAHGRRTALDPATCADGVTETLEVFVPRLHARGHVADLDRPVSLVATDTGDTWTLVPEPGTHPQLDRGSPAEDRVTGTAEQLWLRLWNRGSDVVLSGDSAAVTRLLTSRLSA
jgi:uncharacterized protein (TIGR03083 family)